MDWDADRGSLTQDVAGSPAERAGAGQAEQLAGALGGGVGHARDRCAARRGEGGDGTGHPRGFVAVAAMRNWRQVGGVRLGHQPIVWRKAQERDIAPGAEGDDPAERDRPSRVERSAREIDRAGAAMEDAEDPAPPRVRHECAHVVVGVARMDDDGTADLRRERDLCLEGSELRQPRRVGMVKVQPALANRARAIGERLAKGRKIARGVEAARVVGVNASRPGDEARKARGELTRAAGGGERFADADDRGGAAASRALDGRIAVGLERRVREMRVAVDEGRTRRVRGVGCWRGRCRQAQRDLTATGGAAGRDAGPAAFRGRGPTPPLRPTARGHRRSM